MTAQAKLADTQIAILKAAVGRPDGNIEPLPPTLRGGTRAEQIEALVLQQAKAALQAPEMIQAVWDEVQKLDAPFRSRWWCERCAISRLFGTRCSGRNGAGWCGC